MGMKYFVETGKGKIAGPYSLSEVVDKFGNDVSLIPQDEAAQILDTDSTDCEAQARPSYPTHLEIPTMPKANGTTVLAAIAIVTSLLGTLSIAFGFFVQFGEPAPQLLQFLFGCLGLLINAIAALVALCALIVRPSTVPTIALALAILSSATFLYIPPYTQPKPQKKARQPLASAALVSPVAAKTTTIAVVSVFP